MLRSFMDKCGAAEKKKFWPEFLLFLIVALLVELQATFATIIVPSWVGTLKPGSKWLYLLYLPTFQQMKRSAGIYYLR